MAKVQWSIDRILNLAVSAWNVLFDISNQGMNTVRNVDLILYIVVT